MSCAGGAASCSRTSWSLQDRQTKAQREQGSRLLQQQQQQQRGQGRKWSAHRNECSSRQEAAVPATAPQQVCLCSSLLWNSCAPIIQAAFAGCLATECGRGCLAQPNVEAVGPGNARYMLPCRLQHEMVGQRSRATSLLTAGAICQPFFTQLYCRGWALVCRRQSANLWHGTICA